MFFIQCRENNCNKNTKRSKWGGFPEPYWTRVALAGGWAQPGGPSHTSFTHHEDEVTLKSEMGIGTRKQKRQKEPSKERKKTALYKIDILQEFKTHGGLFFNLRSVGDCFKPSIRPLPFLTSIIQI